MKQENHRIAHIPCNKGISTALADMHDCGLDWQIKMNVDFADGLGFGGNTDLRFGLS